MRPVVLPPRPVRSLLGAVARLGPAALLPILFLSMPAGRASARGLYLELPYYYQRADTSGTEIHVTETWIEGEGYEAAVAGLTIPFNLSSRTAASAGICYPLIHRPGGYKHGFADGMIRITSRISGDSLNTEGLFLRADLRIPIGSNSLRPFSFRSSDGGIYPDVGAGLEYRGSTGPIDFRCSATWTFAGQKDDTSTPAVADFLTAGALVGIAAGGRTSVRLGVFAVDFDGAGYRESYLLAVERSLSDKLVLDVTGMLDAGDDSDRVFDSLVSVSLEYDFSPTAR